MQICEVYLTVRATEAILYRVSVKCTRVCVNTASHTLLLPRSFTRASKIATKTQAILPSGQKQASLNPGLVCSVICRNGTENVLLTCTKIQERHNYSQMSFSKRRMNEKH